MNSMHTTSANVGVGTIDVVILDISARFLKAQLG